MHFKVKNHFVYIELYKKLEKVNLYKDDFYVMICLKFMVFYKKTFLKW